jgi:hypothetical protein
MSRVTAWSLFLLGLAHVVFGLARFSGPVTDALADGFIGQFRVPEVRRTAFWFLMCGPLLMLVGHIAIRAVTNGDAQLLKIIGIYGVVSSMIGILAFPVSPLWILFLVSGFALAVGQGWLR